MTKDLWIERAERALAIYHHLYADNPMRAMIDDALDVATGRTKFEGLLRRHYIEGVKYDDLAAEYHTSAQSLCRSAKTQMWNFAQALYADEMADDCL